MTHELPHELQSLLDNTDAVVITDGGLATELEARGHDLSDALWSARLLLDEPAAITAVHRAFFAAGAMIATTASYQVSFEGLAARGIDSRGTAELLRRSVTLARQARAEFEEDGRPRWIAASVGPYGAMLADGSEYRGRYGLSVRQLRDWHRPRLEVLAEAGPDLLAVETIPDVDEAEAIAPVIADLGIPCWLSYTVSDGKTRAGQPLSDAFAIAAGLPQVLAVGVNCCAPSEVTDAVRLAREITAKPVIAYPNSGETWDATRRTWAGTSQISAERARQWLTAGARLAGGCCRVSPADIGRLAAAAAPTAI